MELSRRQLIVLTGIAAVGGCAPGARDETGQAPIVFRRGPVDAGPLRDYPHDGAYARFRDSGFFVIRQGNRLFARSALCTHRTCKLNAKRDGFLCPCHGSVFTLDGRVTRGPARRDLPGFVVEKAPNGDLIVHTDQLFAADQDNVAGGFVETD